MDHFRFEHTHTQQINQIELWKFERNFHTNLKLVAKKLKHHKYKKNYVNLVCCHKDFIINWNQSRLWDKLSSEVLVKYSIGSFKNIGRISKQPGFNVTPHADQL